LTPLPPDTKYNLKDIEEDDTCQKLFMQGGLFSKILSHYEYRPAQLTMAKAVDEALAQTSTLLVEAATGTGKTWAYLIPAILSRKKIIISTGTLTLQDQLFSKDLPFLAKSLPRPFTYSMMKGKSNYLCLHRFSQSFQQSSFESMGNVGNSAHLESSKHLQIIRKWAERTKSGDRAEISELPESSLAWQEVSVKGDACLGGQCPDYDRCYLTRMKQEAAAADIVVVNHHLFFADLGLKEQGYGEVLPRYKAVIFDEAHLLEETATQYFGVSFSSYRIEDFIRDAEREFRYSRITESDCSEQCKAILLYSNIFFRHFKRGGDRFRLRHQDFSAQALSSGADLKQALERFDRLIEKYHLKSDAVAHLSERIEALLVDLRCFLKEQREEDHYIYWAEQRRNTTFLHTSPLDVSTILEEALFKGEIPMILTSATLSAGGKFDFIRERLGIQQAKELMLDTVFDYEKQSLFYLPKHLPEPSNPQFSAAISDEIVQLLEASEGRAFLLFTSWRNLEAVYQNIAHRLPYQLLKQGEQPKQILIEQFKEDISSVLFGTTSFWQGVDVEGEALSCVIIDKLPFASPSDPLTSARIDALATQGKAPFSAYQIPLAILALRQGIGRLIRNSKDRGLIAILDRRLTSKGYGKKFLKSLPKAPMSDDFKEVLSFFSKD